MKILVTAFDPFGNDQVNPALEAVKQLPQEIAGAQIITLEVPTIFNTSAAVVKEAVDNYRPDVLVNIGQAGGRAGITPERVAINIDDAAICDNAGQQPIDQIIQPDGAAAYFSTLPIKAIVAALKAADIPATVSNTAGTFVCNHLMYQNLYLAQHEYPQMKAGFIHIPYMDEQLGTHQQQKPSLPLATLVKGLCIALEAIVTFDGRPDLQTIEGKIS
ncbi:pyroglutamyl-peptidase I [Allofustis seminis]|uniref:pyroglutamyl-peptidase I n=1 Tax=Allofustis seminis TaxID=166939 RepID=UPI00037D49FA|nr:pyroglutamyl-peptidase I [Allofustis seminis]